MTTRESNKNVFFELIQTEEGLAKLIGLIKCVHTVALDTEADSFHHYRPKVCLIQLSFNGYTAIVDPLAGVSLKPFLEELAAKELVIHDAGYDLRILKGDFNFVPQNGIFDTMLAAALTGMANVGLSSVLQEVLQIQIAKHNQKADWSMRPLPDYLLRYAAEDTCYLMQIRDNLESRLNELGRLDWHRESCRQAVRSAIAAKETPDIDNLWRIKGSGILTDRQMAFLREIWHWRHSIAKRTNVAPFMICRNEDVVKLAIWASHHRKPVEPDAQLPIRCKASYRNALLTALQKAHCLPKDQWPSLPPSDPSKRLPDSVRKIVNILKTECETIAKKNGLPLQWIASRAALTEIVLKQATSLEQIQKEQILLNWQAKLILPAISKVLAEGGQTDHRLSE
ncbi:MAG: HRDC domain-containing protein [Phycisphaerae bacterium]|nr:HRDC domain-containing protein [Phycisphaerae bacterium]